MRTACSFFNMWHSGDLIIILLTIIISLHNFDNIFPFPNMPPTAVQKKITMKHIFLNILFRLSECVSKVQNQVARINNVLD